MAYGQLLTDCSTRHYGAVRSAQQNIIAKLRHLADGLFQVRINSSARLRINAPLKPPLPGMDFVGELNGADKYSQFRETHRGLKQVGGHALAIT